MKLCSTRLASMLCARLAAVLRTVADRLDPRPPAPVLVAAVPPAFPSASGQRPIPLDEFLAQLNLVKAGAILRDALGPRNPPQAVVS